MILVVEDGSYEAESLSALVWLVFRSRLRNFLRGKGWRD